MSQEEDEDGRFAVPGPESHESEETLSADERGAAGEPVPKPEVPAEPYPRRSLLDRLLGRRRS
jgi:hypothetical protein